MYRDIGMTTTTGEERKGTLVAFEGLCRSGKTISINEVAKMLSMNGTNVVVANWNSVQFIRRMIDLLYRIKLLTPQVYSLLQWKSFLINYYFMIYPHLKNGSIVLADRYVYTAYARDLMNGLDRRFTHRLYGFARKADLVLFFKASPEVCYERSRRDKKKLFHLCKRFKEKGSAQNGDLHYLRGLHQTYTDLFNDASLTATTKVVPIGSDDNIHTILESIYRHGCKAGDKQEYSFVGN
jgi:dTMP kinase